MADNLGYHYCSVEILFNILRNNQIYASDPLKSNDSKELLCFAKDFYSIASNISLLNQIEYNVSIDKIVERLIANGQDNLFVTSFSRLEDSLTQWRFYGDNGRGVAIGFNLASFEDEFPSAYIYDVLYDVPKPSEVSEYFADFSTVCKAYGGPFDDKKLQDAFFDLMILYMARYKSKAFSSENEIRLMVEKRPWNYKLFEDNSSTRRYSEPSFETDYRLTYGNQDITEYAKIAIPKQGIKEIVLGPRCLLKERDVHNMAEKYFGYNIVVRKSSIRSI